MYHALPAIGGLFVIHEGVTTFGSRSFEGCTKLEEVAIPSCVVSIKSDAFDGCDELRVICDDAERIRAMELGNIKVMSY